MYVRSLLLAIFITFSYSLSAQDTTNTSFGKGMLNLMARDSSWSVKFAPRVQFRAESKWDYEGDKFGKPEQDFLIRRARLKFDGFAFSPKLQYKIELGLSNRDLAGTNKFTGNTPRYILDAVVMWNFYENFELWAGQTKLPGNIERVVSSANLQLIDRSLLNSRFNIDRDVGIQLRHHFTLMKNIVVREKFALSQGEGRNITTGNLGGHQYTSRIEVLPFGVFEGKSDDYIQSDLKRHEKPKLMLGVTYDYNNNAVKTRSNQGTYMQTSTGFYETDISTWFADAMFKYRGISIMTEYASREAAAPIAVEENGMPAVNEDGLQTGAVVLTGEAFNIQAGYLFKNNYELATRFTTADFDAVTGVDLQEQYTLGFSKYFVGHKLKIQSDVNYTALGGQRDSIEFRMGFDLHF